MLSLHLTDLVTRSLAGHQAVCRDHWGTVSDAPGCHQQPILQGVSSHLGGLINVERIAFMAASAVSSLFCDCSIRSLLLCRVQEWVLHTIVTFHMDFDEVYTHSLSMLFTCMSVECYAWCGQEVDQRLRVDASSARQEILQMCEGMHCIRLPTSTNAEVTQQYP